RHRLPTLHESLFPRRFTFSGVRRIMSQRHRIQQSDRLALNLSVPTKTARRPNLPANSSFSLTIQLRLTRMSNLTLSDSTIQHRMSRNSLISRRSKNLQLTQTLGPQSVNQIARTRTAINRHQRETRFTLHQEINQPLRAFTHRSLPNRLHMNRPITATHSTRQRHMRPIRSELHAE